MDISASTASGLEIDSFLSCFFFPNSLNVLVDMFLQQLFSSRNKIHLHHWLNLVFHQIIELWIQIDLDVVDLQLLISKYIITAGES